MMSKFSLVYVLRLLTLLPKTYGGNMHLYKPSRRFLTSTKGNEKVVHIYN